MEIIGAIITLILAIIGGVLGTVANVPAPVMFTPDVPPALPAETVAVAPVDTIDYTPASEHDYNIPADAYNVNIERDIDRVNVGYNLTGGNGEVCTVSAVYYDAGSAVSGITCDPLPL